MNLRRIDFGTLLSSTFQLYMDNFVRLITISAVFVGLTVVVVAGIVTAIATVGILALIPAIGGAVLLMVASILLQGVFVLAVTDIQTGAPERSVGELISAAMPRFWALLGTGLLAGLAIFIGILFCLLPGIAFAVLFTVVGAVVMLEGLSGPEALSRSWNLVKGEFWSVLALVVVVGIIVAVVNGIAGAILGGILGVGGGFLHQIGRQLPSVITAPISAVLSVLIYFALVQPPTPPADPTGTPAGYPAPPQQ